MERLKITEGLLWDYVEGGLSEKQRGKLESALEQDAKARQKLKEIRLLSNTLQNMETEAPSMRFTANVMQAWDQELALLKAPLQTRTDKRIVWGIAAVLLICLALLFGMLIPVTIGAVPAEIFRYKPQITHAVTDFFLNKQLIWYFLGLGSILLLVLAERYLHYRQFVKHLS